ncbi:clan AA aspartic protease [Metallosphaera javensis (ex Sakai et al. 2022)]|uniref:clan AA aspartic protease n=1 Tax=Metallosphaera javensis (ex Sakai et al. 2022) TaxID=2775498 RepID=UPI00258E52CE|nr:MAG: hypothetical protein MjAS7_1235 [Metallosphaera javensis (ex Sakai et al. 2022)]
MGIDCLRVTDRPEIGVEVLDPSSMESVKVNAIVDTGFSGWLLVPFRIYQRISSLELHEDKWNVYSTLIGNVRTRVARSIITLGGVKIHGFVETPVFGRELYLVGRELLKRIELRLVKGQEVCVGDP